MKWFGIVALMLLLAYLFTGAQHTAIPATCTGSGEPGPAQQLPEPFADTLDLCRLEKNYGYITVNAQKLALHDTPASINSPAVILAEFTGHVYDEGFGSYHRVDIQLPEAAGAMQSEVDSVRKTLQVEHCFEHRPGGILELSIDIHQKEEHYHPLSCTWVTSAQTAQHYEKHYAFPAGAEVQRRSATTAPSRNKPHIHS